MFPLADAVTHHARVTRWLILINVLVFLALFLGSGGYLGQPALDAVEADLPGLVFVPARLGVDPAGGLLSLFTSMFLHAGWLHLLGNMWFLWVFGDNIEDHLGTGRFLLFYLLGGVAAALSEGVLGSPQTAMVGASGAIAAVLGAYLVLLPKAWIRTYLPPFFIFHVPAYIYLPYWALLQYCSLRMGETGVALYAHLGGFVFGFVVMLFLRQKPRRQVVSR